MYRAVLDTCVLVPSLQRDFVLQLAAESTFVPQWSSGVLDELEEVLGRLDARRGRAIQVERHRGLVAQMRHVFPGATIPAPREGDYRYGLNDPADEHVLHAALIGGSDAIVTDDRRSGLEAAAVVHEAGIEILPVHDFLANTVSAHREAAANAVLELFRRRTNPPAPSPLELLEHLCRDESMGEVFDLLCEPLSSRSS